MTPMSKKNKLSQESTDRKRWIRQKNTVAKRKKNSNSRLCGGVLNQYSPPILADEIFHNGMIRPIYPIFNPNFFLGSTKYHESIDESRMNSGLFKGVKTGTPPRKFFTEERETSTTSLCSSSETNELDEVSAEMYCVWQPKPSAEGRFKKSSSTGWKFKGFLQKGHSVGSFANAYLNNGVRNRAES